MADLREILESLVGSDEKTVARLWRQSVMPDLLEACSVWQGDLRITSGLLTWLDTQGAALIRRWPDGWADHQVRWAKVILDATVRLHTPPDRRGPAEVPESLAEELASRYEVAPTHPYPLAFWRDLISYLRGLRRPVSNRCSILFPLVGNKAVIAKLRLELTGEGSGEVFLAPEQVLSRHMDTGFAQIFSDAAQIVKAQLGVGELHLSDVRVWVEAYRPCEDVTLRSYQLKDDSAGGALAVGLRNLWTGKLTDPSLVLSFALKNEGRELDGKCHPVEGDYGKVEGCKKEGLATLVMSEEQRPDEAEAFDAWATDQGVRIHRVQTLAQAAEFASGVPEELQKYYETLIQELQQTSWRHKNGDGVRLGEIAIPIKVLREDGVPEQGEIRDRSGVRQYLAQDPVLGLMDPEVARLYEPPMEDRAALPWEHELKNANKAAISGDPGAGRSFLISTMAIQLAEEGLCGIRGRKSIDELPLPIVADVDRLAEVLSYETVEDPAPLLSVMRANTGLGEQFKFWAMEKVKRSSLCYLILDDWDRVPAKKRDVLVRWMNNVDVRWASRRIVTCRSLSRLSAELPWRGVAGYKLAPFELSDIRRFVDWWFADDPVKASSLRALLDTSYSLALACRNPLMATLTCLVHEEHDITAGVTQRGVYARAVRHLLERYHKPSGKTDMANPVDQRRQLLTDIAWSVFPDDADSDRFSGNTIAKALARSMRKGKTSPEVVIALDALEGSGILTNLGRDVCTDEQQFSFRHRSFLDYLVARHLGREVNEKQAGWSATVVVDNRKTTFGELLDRKAWDPAWRNVVIFLAGELKDPAPLLEMLSDVSRDDRFRHRLALAVLCLPDAMHVLRARQQDTIGKHLQPLADGITAQAIAFWHDWYTGRHGSMPRCWSGCLTALAAVNAGCEGQPLLDWLSDEFAGGDAEFASFTVEATGETALRYPRLLTTLIDEALNCPDRERRLRAARVLTRCAPDADQLPELFDAVVRELGSPNPELRVWAIGLVKGSILRHDELIDLLLSLALDGPDDLHEQVGAVLALLETQVLESRVIGPLLEHVQRGEGDVRVRAVQLLGGIGEVAARSPRVVPRLAESLDHPALAEHAAHALGSMADPVVVGIPEVLPKMLRHAAGASDDQVYRSALRAFGAALLSRPDEITGVLLCLRSADSRMRRAALNVLYSLCEALGASGLPEAVVDKNLDALRRLAEIRHRDNLNLRRLAAADLAHLRLYLADYPLYTRFSLVTLKEAVELIGHNIAEGPRIAEEVSDILADSWRYLRWSYEVERHVGTDRTLTGHLADGIPFRLLRCDDPADVLENYFQTGASPAALPPTHVLRTAIDALSDDAGVLTRLETALRDEDKGTRAIAVSLLAFIGERSARVRGVIEDLLDLLRAENPELRLLSVLALGEMGSAVATDGRVVRELSDVARDDAEDSVQESARAALRFAVDPPGLWEQDRASRLAECVDEPSSTPGRRLMLVELLEEVAQRQEPLPDAVGALVKLAEADPDEVVRERATLALANVGPQKAGHPSVMPTVLDGALAGPEDNVSPEMMESQVVQFVTRLLRDGLIPWNVEVRDSKSAVIREPNTKQRIEAASRDGLRKMLFADEPDPAWIQPLIASMADLISAGDGGNELAVLLLQAVNEWGYRIIPEGDIWAVKTVAELADIPRPGRH
ncbi:MAG: HEAT repeat domain-containing protein [Armatimonadetes bacterium]|nr:HEAT repeat domain-containing protein [Armatimonadota bacterium]